MQFHCVLAPKVLPCFWVTADRILSCLYDGKPECLIFSQQEASPWFTMLSIYSEIHSVKCINHIKWCAGLLLAGWVKCIPCQTRQPAGPLRKILIDTAVAFNQLGKHESSLRCAQACLCQRKGKPSGGGGGGRGAERRRQVLTCQWIEETTSPASQSSGLSVWRDALTCWDAAQWRK